VSAFKTGGGGIGPGASSFLSFCGGASRDRGVA
jgi:hypothetical protein